MTPTPGLHHAVPFADYQQWEAVNQSALQPMKRSPLHCRWEIDHPSAPSDAMVLGSALHAAAFDPGEFARQFVKAPKFDRRTKSGKEDAAAFDAANTGRVALDPDDWVACNAMADSIRNCDTARQFVEAAGNCEVSMLWRDKPTGLLAKGRADRLVTLAGSPWIVEVKTTRNASVWAFGKAIADYGYHAQAAHYIDGYETITGQTPGHAFIAVENEPPHACAVYLLGDSSLQTGRALIRRWLDRFAECSKSGRWPGYPDRADVIEIPHYAMEIEQ